MEFKMTGKGKLTLSCTSHPTMELVPQDLPQDKIASTIYGCIIFFWSHIPLTWVCLSALKHTTTLSLWPIILN